MLDISPAQKHKVWIGHEKNLNRVINDAADVCCLFRKSTDDPWEFIGTRELPKAQLLGLLASLYDMCTSQGVIEKRDWQTSKEREGALKAQMINSVVPYLGLNQLPINKKIILNPQAKKPGDQEELEVVPLMEPARPDNLPSIGTVPL